jgi:hypothetical protein
MALSPPPGAAGGAGAAGGPASPHDARVDELVRLLMSSLRVGRVISTAGASCDVYEAKWDGARVLVALKLMKGASTLSAAHREEFLHEGATLAPLRHPNIVTVYGVVVDETVAGDPKIGIVLELMAGGSVHHAIANPATCPPLAKRLHWWLDAAYGLRYLHGRKPHPLIHADIKALNILIDREGNGKLADFGLSRLRLGTTTKATGGTGGSGERVGTLPWMAPELFGLGGAKRVGIRSDVYAMGVTLWEVCACRVPYLDLADEVLDLAGQLHMLVRGGGGDEPIRPTLSLLPADTPPAVRDVMQRMWAPRPEDRCTLDEAIAAVEAAVEAMGSAAPAAPAVMAPAPAPALPPAPAAAPLPSTVEGCVAAARDAGAASGNVAAALRRLRELLSAAGNSDALLPHVAALVGVADARSGDTGALEAVWAVLAMMVGARYAAGKRAPASDADVARLVRLLDRHASDAAALRGLLVATRVVCWDDGACVAVVRAGGIERVVRALEAHGSVAGVAEAACRAVQGMSGNADNEVAIARAGGIERVVRALDVHGGVAGVAEAACWALRNLSVDADNCVAIARAGGIAGVVRALEAHGGVAGVAEGACGALRNLSTDSADNRVSIARAGGIAGVVRALEAHGGVAGVAEAACMTLRNLSVDADNRVAITRAGGIAGVVRALETHGGVVGVAEAACMTLRNLSYDNADNRVAIARAGGIAGVVRALDAHGGVAGVAEAACRALWNLSADNADNCVAIARAGGIAGVVRALDAHGGVAGVAKAACGALRNLSADNADNRVAIARAGGIAGVVRALEAHGGVAAVVTAALGALWGLAIDNADNKAAMARAGVPAKANAALARHPGDEEVQRMWAGLQGALK